MSDKLKALVGIGIAVSWSGLLIAQGVVTQRNLSLAMAKTIAEAALAECKAKGGSILPRRWSTAPARCS